MRFALFTLFVFKSLKNQVYNLLLNYYNA